MGTGASVPNNVDDALKVTNFFFKASPICFVASFHQQLVIFTRCPIFCFVEKICLIDSKLAARLATVKQKSMCILRVNSMSRSHDRLVHTCFRHMS